MSVCYDFYLEGKVDGRWVCLDGFVNGPDGKVWLRPIMSGGSILRELVDEVGGEEIDLDSVSPEVWAVCRPFSPSSHSPALRWFDPKDARVPEGRYEYERYVLREEMNAFENGQADSIYCWLTEAEYAALDEEERLVYSFFRWDDPWGTFALRRSLQERVRHAVGFYEWMHGFGRVSGLRVVVRTS